MPDCVVAERCGPVAQRGERQKEYIEVMRYYTTKPMKLGVSFKCTLCEHTVSTLDFDSTKGNRRTQAAGAINQHVAGSHLHQRVPVSAKYGGRVSL
jgi:hypothetical protein